MQNTGQQAIMVTAGSYYATVQNNFVQSTGNHGIHTLAPIGHITGNAVRSLNTGSGIRVEVDDGSTYDNGIIVSQNRLSQIPGDGIVTVESNGTLDGYIITDNIAYNESINDNAAGSSALVNNNL